MERKKVIVLLGILFVLACKEAQKPEIVVEDQPDKTTMASLKKGVDGQRFSIELI